VSHPETVGMNKLERRISGSDFGPVTPYTKVPLADVGVVKHHNATRAHLWEPRREIMRNSFVSMKPIYMEKINAPIGKLGQCLIKRTAYEGRKRTVKRVVIITQFAIHLVAIRAGIFVAFPMVHSETCGLQTQRMN